MSEDFDDIEWEDDWEDDQCFTCSQFGPDCQCGEEYDDHALDEEEDEDDSEE